MYITANGVELKLSSKPSSWIGTSGGFGVKLGTGKADSFNGIVGDRLSGGLGDDTYTMWDATAVAIELPGQGIDTLVANFWGKAILPDNVENLVLAGPGLTAATGNALNNIIIAGKQGATIDGQGGDDVLVGGAGADVFRVQAGNGSDAIQGFTPGFDVVQLNGYGFTSFAQLQSASKQVGADVRIDLGNGEALVLRDVALNTLQGADFGFKMTPTATPGFSTMDGGSRGWNANGWYVLNNAWNPGKLKDGIDFAVNSSFDKADMTAGTTFTWSFPYVTDVTSTIRAYPNVMFGVGPHGEQVNPTDTSNVFPTKLSDIVALTAIQDTKITGNAGGFNVSYDIWFTSVPRGGASTITNEVMIWTHQGDVKPFGTLVGTYSDGALTAKIYHKDTYTAVVFDQDALTGTLDIAKILDRLETLGILSGDEYLSAINLGSEVVSGTGALTINNLDLNVVTLADTGVVATKITGAGSTATAIAYQPGETKLLDTAGAVVGTKAVSIDATGLVTVSYYDAGAKLVGAETIRSATTGTITSHLDTKGVLTGSETVRVEANGAVTTEFYSAAGKLTGVETAITLADGSVRTDHYDARGQLTGWDIGRIEADGVQVLSNFARTGSFTGIDRVTTDTTGAVTTKHYDPAGALTGMDIVKTDASGAVTTHRYDASYTFIGADTVKPDAQGRPVTTHYDAKWQMTGSELAITDANGVVTVHHYDKTFAFTGAESTKVAADGAVTVTHYDAKWGFAGADVTRIDAAGVTTVTHYDAKWAMVETDHLGTAGADVLVGTYAANEFHGGLGSDVIKASWGADAIYFDTAIGNGDVDRITSFNPAMDTIFLDRDVFEGLGSLGTLNANAFVIGTEARDADDRIIYDRATGNLYYDADGKGGAAAVLFAQFDPGTALTYADLHVVV